MQFFRHVQNALFRSVFLPSRNTSARPLLSASARPPRPSARSRSHYGRRPRHPSCGNTARRGCAHRRSLAPRPADHASIRRIELGVPRMWAEVVLNIGVRYHNLIVTAHIGTLYRPSKGRKPPDNPPIVFTNLNMLAICRAIHNLTFLFLLPCSNCGKRKRAQSPAAASVRPWNALRETTKEDTPIGAHSPLRRLSQ